MYSESVEKTALLSIDKKIFLSRNWRGYFVASMLAGIYVGFGIILIFSIASPFVEVDSPAVKLIMGLSFGVALTLVVFAGSELFTGNTMVMCIGFLKKQVGFSDSARVLTVSWIGNLFGSLLIAFFVVHGGSVKHAMFFFQSVSVAKINATIWELLIRGILCNMLVCLALWTSSRAKSDTAKIFLIFWSLFAFIGAGFEHSVANMSLLAIGIIGNPSINELTWTGYFYNLFWVTLGNFIGGAFFIGGAYYITTGSKGRNGI